MFKKIKQFFCLHKWIWHGLYYIDSVSKGPFTRYDNYHKYSCKKCGKVIITEKHMSEFKKLYNPTKKVITAVGDEMEVYVPL